MGGQGRSLQDSLVELFQRYDLPLNKEKILTVCGKCGGEIVTCESDEYVRHASCRQGDIPWVPTDRQLFMCKECYQVSREYIIWPPYLC